MVNNVPGESSNDECGRDSSVILSIAPSTDLTVHTRISEESKDLPFMELSLPRTSVVVAAASVAN